MTASITCYTSEIKMAVSLVVDTTTEMTALARCVLLLWIEVEGLFQNPSLLLLFPKLFGRVRVCSNFYLPEISQHLQTNRKALPNVLETSRCHLNLMEFN